MDTRFATTKLQSFDERFRKIEQKARQGLFKIVHTVDRKEEPFQYREYANFSPIRKSTNLPMLKPAFLHDLSTSTEVNEHPKSFKSLIRTNDFTAQLESIDNAIKVPSKITQLSKSPLRRFKAGQAKKE